MCDCGHTSPALNSTYHCEGCVAGGGFTARDAHNSVVAAIVTSCNRAGIRAVNIDAAHEEFQVGSQRPDFKLIIDGRELVYDLTIAHPLTDTLLPVPEPAILASKAAEKTATYKALSEALDFTFVPLVVWSTGLPTSALVELATLLSGHSPHSAGWFLRIWSVALAQATGRTLAKIDVAAPWRSQVRDTDLGLGDARSRGAEYPLPASHQVRLYANVGYSRETTSSITVCFLQNVDSALLWQQEELPIRLRNSGI